MSFIVKGAEMPKTCLDCPLADVEQGWCDSDMVTIIDFDERPVECPLVALPDKHGRLGDLDALIYELNNSHYPGAPYVDAGISIAIGKVCDAHTIVEAEDEP